MFYMNNFSEEWTEIYANGEQLTSWPWSDLVSLVYRYCKDPINKKGKVLELGCGSGPNIPFIQSLGMSYYGIDGSSTAIQVLHQKFPKLKNNILIGDFTNMRHYSDIPDIDIIVDRASVAHNDLSSIKQILNHSYDKLKTGGYFVGIDWFSTKHCDSKMGVKSNDENTRTDIKKGQFKNVGNVHFSDKNHLQELFSEFDIIFLEEKVINNIEPNGGYQSASWNIVAKKYR